MRGKILIKELDHFSDSRERFRSYSVQLQPFGRDQLLEARLSACLWWFSSGDGRRAFHVSLTCGTHVDGFGFNATANNQEVERIFETLVPPHGLATLGILAEGAGIPMVSNGKNRGGIVLSNASSPCGLHAEETEISGASREGERKKNQEEKARDAAMAEAIEEGSCVGSRTLIEEQGRGGGEDCSVLDRSIKGLGLPCHRWKVLCQLRGEISRVLCVDRFDRALNGLFGPYYGFHVPTN